MSPAYFRDHADQICRSIGIEYATITARNGCRNLHRKPETIAARGKLIVLLRDKYGMSFPECAECVGHSTHTAALQQYQIAKAYGYRA